MTIDGKHAERIASDLIRAIASEWVDTPDTRCLKESDSYIFEFTLLPTEIVRYARKVERPLSPSIFRFDPLAEAVEIVLQCASKLTGQSMSESAIESRIRKNAHPRILQMLFSAPKVFAEAMWEARIVGETLAGIETMKLLGRPDIARGLMNSAVKLIEKKVRERFGEIKQKQKLKITPLDVDAAIIEFLPRFKETGAVPSRNKFAKQLGVSPKGWRDYLDRHQLGEHDTYLKELFEIFSGKN